MRRIAIPKHFDFQSARELIKEIKRMPSDGAKEVVVDLSETRYIDSSGLGSLLIIRNHFAPAQIALSFSGNGGVATALRDACFGRIFRLQEI